MSMNRKARYGWKKDAWMAYKKWAEQWIINMLHAHASNQAVELMMGRED